MWPISVQSFDDYSSLTYGYTDEGGTAWFIFQLRRGDSEAKRCLEFYEEMMTKSDDDQI